MYKKNAGKVSEIFVFARLFVPFTFGECRRHLRKTQIDLVFRSVCTTFAPNYGETAKISEGLDVARGYCCGHCVLLDVLLRAAARQIGRYVGRRGGCHFSVDGVLDAVLHLLPYRFPPDAPAPLARRRDSDPAGADSAECRYYIVD